MKQHKEYSDNELRKVALMILTQHLGHANALRFLSLHFTSNVDYMTLRQELFEGLTAKYVYENATEFWHNRDKRQFKQED